jgi:magnesium chelatase subunit D
MHDYPFAALVGQEQLKTALCVIAVNPAIGGLLIRGEKGTAKSTAARALAGLLPPMRMLAGCPFNCDPDAPWHDCPHHGAEHAAVERPVPFVDLPLGATEDRVLGTLDFERALREGKRSFQPGLLAAAHRGILYIDEVNLLADHLVDVLLDAAALGVNTVQREGMAVIHPARFLLIGTMNPEEGDLRPQLLDRFGLMVEVASPREPEVRAEVVRRRLAYESDPVAFAAAWAGDQTALRERIVAARARLPQVRVADNLLNVVTQICCEFEVDGLRADIAMHKTAQALAAFEGRLEVTSDDVRAAALFVLPHRRRRKLFEQPGLDQDRLAATLGRTQTESPIEGAESGSAASAAGNQVFEPSPPDAVRRLQVRNGDASPPSRGRRNPAPASDHGQYVRAVADESPRELAIDATLRAAAGRGSFQDGRLVVERRDLHRKERQGKTGTHILFVVDSSGSMAARRRMELVKGAALRLLEDAYQQRDQVGIIAFRGPEAEVLLPFTGSIEPAERALRTLPTGGRTPLAHALSLAADMVHNIRQTSQDMPVLIVLVTDGKANVPLPGSSGDPWPQALQVARQLAQARAVCLVLDSEVGFIRSGRARELAETLGAKYLPLEGLSAEELLLRIQTATPPG